MPRFLKHSVFATLILFLLAPPLGAAEWPHPGTRSLASEKPFAELVTALSGAIKDNGMFTVSKASASAGAKRRGVDIAGNMVIGVFRNDYAVRMLDASIQSGIEAPLRFYLTANADGSANLTYRTPTAVFAPYKSAALDEMAAELDAIFAAIAAQAVEP
ncbi:MAG: DUF302 domain-containing protein [Rhodospirillaceae bacterium]|nr:DUF302 domain-containing protein [Rhodospirillaceae bacterium]MBT3627286.1 DUF302 domain-containing protein [Rhodospirillaceae bacterium]MBT3926856.1 DUF302 domain-containing protein [Rhodospirillaceae bacterium]